VNRAVVFVVSQGAICFGALAFGDFELIAQIHGRNTEELVIAFNPAFDVSL